MNHTLKIMGLLKKFDFLSKTNFVILFGSVAKETNNPLSDVDICISLDLPAKARLNARIKLSGTLPEKYDIQIFEDLPLYLQKSVLSGKVLYCKNKKKLIEKAISIIKEYGDFKKVYDYYLSKNKAAVEI